MRLLSSVLAIISLVAAACTPGTAEPTTPTLQGPSPTTVTSTSTSSVPATTAAPLSRPAFCEIRWEPNQTGVVESNELNEISGAAISLRHEGVVWLHNDSGSDPSVWAADVSGTDLGRVSLPDLTARDWEDIALGPGPDPTLSYLYLADIGDNSARRDDVRIHRIPEPVPETGVMSGGETLVITYPSGPVEAETLLVDPTNGDIVLAGKALSGTTPLYGLPGDVDWSLPHQATFLGEIELGTFALATGGDAGASRIVIRTYDEVFTWERPPGASLAEALLTPPCRIAAVDEEQGEAIALTPDEQGFYTVSEGANQPISRFTDLGSNGS